MVAAAWYLPPLEAALLGIALLASGTVWSWAEELACDLDARRHCGAAAQAAMWRAQIVRDRTTPRLRRWWDALASTRSHPPGRLRMLLGSVAAFSPSPGVGAEKDPARVTPGRAPQDGTLSP
ncbi:hypothetical protein [Kitasatospora sp. NPDC058218]|uniref:hypothetical protein n=1 Tax=Kitasatospora sp. NPDC058218 TaxID=3346385 RepID=UPI0036D83FFB